jgi:DNA-binding response OmpR family regulator
LKLLLLEDDPVSRAFLCEVLSAAPAVVDCAETCAGAETFAKGGEHALWIFDANLPDGNGADLLQRLRALGLGTPAMALTAESCRERLDELSAAGFREVLQKPIAANVLIAAIHRLAAGMHSNELPNSLSPVLWDEAQALAAVGGRPESALALRKLFLDELPGQVASIRTAFVASDHAEVRHHLHRLKASCGFVGASRLLVTVNRLSDDMTASSFQDFMDIAARQIESETLKVAAT